MDSMSITSEQSEIERAVYTAREVKHLTGLDIRTVYKLAREGSIPSIRVGRKFIFPRIGVHRWLSEAGNRTAA